MTTLIQEICPVKDFPEYYICENGDAYSRQTGRIKKLKQGKDLHGYLHVELHKDKKRYIKLVHRLIAEAFIPNPENKPQVNHKNGIKTDNRVENLEWNTASENVRHRFEVLGQKCGPRTGKPVLQIKDGVIIAKFTGTHDAKRKTGINQGDISSCCRGKLKSAGGFQWKYERWNKGGQDGK